MDINVTTTREAGLVGASDLQQFTYASQQDRVIFTQDDDYLKLHAIGIRHAGIAYCHVGSRSVGEIIRSLTLIWEIYEPEEMRNRVEYL
jgi:predicted nuclease of predicted toxin-antitoxin system